MTGNKDSMMISECTNKNIEKRDPFPIAIYTSMHRSHPHPNYHVQNSLKDNLHENEFNKEPNCGNAELNTKETQQFVRQVKEGKVKVLPRNKGPLRVQCQVINEPLEEDVLDEDELSFLKIKVMKDDLQGGDDFEVNLDNEPATNRSIDKSSDGRKKCPYCPKTFLRKSSLRKHLVIHRGDQAFKCNYCPQSFGYKSTFETHLRAHTGEKPFKCSYCSKTFSQRSHLQRHLKTQGYCRPDNKPLVEDSLEFDEEVLAFINKHGNRIIEVTEDDLKGRDGVDLYYEPVTRNEEGKRIKKRHYCSHCPKSFSKKSSLQRHFGRHTGNQPFKCIYCTQSFVWKSLLETHLRSHTGEKPFKCSHCSRTFTQNSHLRRHLRSLESN